MKEVPTKDTPEVSGGVYHEGGCIPLDLPSLDDYPRNPLGPDITYIETVNN